MLAQRRTASKGFTLVEILIVVIILGILAAIVIPQFTSASNDARNTSLSRDWSSDLSSTDLYKLQHLDNLPSELIGGAKDWSQFINKTNSSGTTEIGRASCREREQNAVATDTLKG